MSLCLPTRPLFLFLIGSTSVVVAPLKIVWIIQECQCAGVSFSQSFTGKLMHWPFSHNGLRKASCWACKPPWPGTTGREAAQASSAVSWANSKESPLSFRRSYLNLLFTVGRHDEIICVVLKSLESMPTSVPSCLVTDSLCFTLSQHPVKVCVCVCVCRLVLIFSFPISCWQLKQLSLIKKHTLFYWNPRITIRTEHYTFH